MQKDYIGFRISSDIKKMLEEMIRQKEKKTLKYNISPKTKTDIICEAIESYYLTMISSATAYIFPTVWERTAFLHAEICAKSDGAASNRYHPFGYGNHLRLPCTPSCAVAFGSFVCIFSEHLGEVTL